jgi:acyl dehydratase
MSKNAQRLYFEDINVGDEIITQSRTITEADIHNFASISADYNPLHMDEEFAKKQFLKKELHMVYLVFVYHQD